MVYNRQIKIMKKYLVIWVAVIGLVFSANAQTQKEINKERAAIAKMSRAELNAKVSKDAKKEAKKLAKAGWTAAPGALPLEKQLDRSYLMQMEYDVDLYPKYIMGEAMSIGENYDAAKMQALELAKQSVAAKIQTEITSLIENTVANKQLSSEQAASVAQSVSAGKNLIVQSLGTVIPVVEVYRTLGNKKDKTKNKEVLVRIAYNGEMSKEIAKKAIRQDLEQRGDELHQKLDQLLGW